MGVAAERGRGLGGGRLGRIRAALLLLSALSSGCSIIWAPDRTQIVDPDGGYDAGVDADVRLDAGRDADVDAGCVVREAIEVTCDNTLDDDCDGEANCSDFDCRGFEDCCRASSALPHCADEAVFWEPLPTGTTDIVLDGAACDGIDSFGTPGLPRALITRSCQPITFGMRFDVRFRIGTACVGPTCDWAALTFTNVKALTNGSELDDQFRLVVFADGSARVERAGTIVGTPLAAGTLASGVEHEARINLEPAADGTRDVLYATVTIATQQVLTRTALMPLADVQCLSGGTRTAGLFAALEGSGEDVDIVNAVNFVERECASPSQFTIPQNPDQITAALEACAPGGAGAPSLVSYCAGACNPVAGSPYRWDAWVDASLEPRDDDFFRRIDFGVCGYTSSLAVLPDGDPGWLARGMAGSFDWMSETSSREPTVLPLANDSDEETRVESLWYAYARRVSDTSDDHAIFGGEIAVGATSQGDGGAMILAPLMEPVTGCRSLRDPLLLADWATAGGGHRVEAAWLLFTCEPTSGMRSIQAVRITFDMVTGTFVVDGEAHTLLTATPGARSYAAVGVSAPEGFIEADGEDATWRIWYSARNSDGRLQLAFAEGRGAIDDAAPPALEPYPANPILNGSSIVLGSDCSMGCSLTGASVTGIAVQVGQQRDYQFLIARSRNTATGAVHELVPLLQPRPLD